MGARALLDVLAALPGDANVVSRLSEYRSVLSDAEWADLQSGGDGSHNKPVSCPPAPPCEPPHAPSPSAPPPPSPPPPPHHSLSPLPSRAGQWATPIIAGAGALAVTLVGCCLLVLHVRGTDTSKES